MAGLPRGLWPRRPLLRIVALLAVAFAAIVVAAVVFAGPPTDTEPAAVAAVVADTAAPQGTDARITPRPNPAPSPAVAAPPAPPATQAATASAPPAPETDAPAPPPSAAVATEPAPENAAPEAAAPGREDPTPQAGSATQIVEQLRPLIAAPRADIPTYDRDHFAGWLDGDGDCVNTRHEVLQSEALGFSMNAAGCAVTSGEWFDPYTGRTYTNPRDLDVDHVVALADAWVSGAWAWADELLDRFSNDFGNLNAIASGENRSKSARGPADYSPSAPGARCEYLVQYATVKIRWQLSITPADFAATERGLASCDAGATPVTPVRTQSPPAPSAAAAPATTAAAAPGCHPAYEPCLPNLPGDALNCGDLTREQRPVTVLVTGTDPYRLDRDGDGRGCTS